MGKTQALHAARKAMASGYRHHSHASAQQMVEAVIKGTKGSEILGVDLYTYADVLGPTRLRGMKNGLICFITLICRVAIDNGVENELSFALSDYYVNAVELQTTEAQLQGLMGEIVELYLELVREEQLRAYSLPVRRAIRHIQLHLYDDCRVEGVARHIGLTPGYFAGLFKKEVGLGPGAYIRQKRMEEARYLLRQTGMSVTEVAEALGYCNPSHFIRVYKQCFGCTPKREMGSPEL